MSPLYYQLSLGFILSFVISFLLIPFIRRLAIKYGYVDFPNRKHPAILHVKPIPRAGGVALFCTFLMSTLLLAQKDPLLWGIILGGLLNVIVGTIDDKFNLSPGLRLGVQIFSGAIVVLSGISFYMSNPLTGGISYFNQFILHLPSFLPDKQIILPADLILIIWIVWLMNTANWSKGVSQLPGVSLIAFLTLAGVALKYQAGNPYQMQTALLSMICAGAVLAFIPFNFPPEKMFPGFGGSTWIGFNLAVLSVLSGGKVATILMVFALPVIDAILVGLKRIFTGQNPLQHDREHLYHFLLNSGLSKRQIIYFYWGTTAILGASSLFLESKGKIISIILLTITISVFFVYLYWKKRRMTKWST